MAVRIGSRSFYLEANHEKMQKFFVNFNQDWINPQKAFHSPEERTSSIRHMILGLIKEGKLQEARSLFELSKKKDAWNPYFGNVKVGSFTDKALTNICNLRMHEA